MISAAAIAAARQTRIALGQGLPSPFVVAGSAEGAVLAELDHVGVLAWQALLDRPRVTAAQADHLEINGQIDGRPWTLRTPERLRHYRLTAAQVAEVNALAGLDGDVLAALAVAGYEVLAR